MQRDSKRAVRLQLDQRVTSVCGLVAKIGGVMFAFGGSIERAAPSVGGARWYLDRFVSMPCEAVHTTLRLPLLPGVVLKCQQFATSPAAEARLLTSRWLPIGVVDIELNFGPLPGDEVLSESTWFATAPNQGVLIGASLG